MTESIVIKGVEIPNAPECPDWCTKRANEHPAAGWDEIAARPNGATAEKMCEQIFLDVRSGVYAQSQVAHWHFARFDSTDSCGIVVDDHWAINGEEVTVEQLTSMVLALTPALAPADIGSST
jgi:hypothetical protein